MIDRSDLSRYFRNWSDFDIVQENTEDLITALVGSEKGSADMNIKTSLDMMKTTLQTAIENFVRRLDTKFNNIATWSKILICPPPSGKCAPPWQNVPIPRSLVFQNGSSEEYAEALEWFNETISNFDLTEQEEIVKEYILSNPDILSDILKPL